MQNEDQNPQTKTIERLEIEKQTKEFLKKNKITVLPPFATSVDKAGTKWKNITWQNLEE